MTDSCLDELRWGRDRTGTAWAHLQDSWRHHRASRCATEACIGKSDLSCGCQWWCPHGHALRYGTWPLSGPSVWPFLFAASRHSWPEEPVSSPRVRNPRPTSPPGTTRPPCPSPSGTEASERHSWKKQKTKKKNRWKVKRMQNDVKDKTDLESKNEKENLWMVYKCNRKLFIIYEFMFRFKVYLGALGWNSWKKKTDEQKAIRFLEI